MSEREKSVMCRSRRPSAKGVSMSIGECTYCGVYGGHDADCEVFYTSIRTDELDRLRAQVAEGRELLVEARSHLIYGGWPIDRVDAYLAATATQEKE